MVVTGPATEDEEEDLDVDAAVVTPGTEVTVKNDMRTTLTKRMTTSGRDLGPYIAFHAKRKAILLKIAQTYNFFVILPLDLRNNQSLHQRLVSQAPYFPQMTVSNMQVTRT